MLAILNPIPVGADHHALCGVEKGKIRDRLDEPTQGLLHECLGGINEVLWHSAQYLPSIGRPTLLGTLSTPFGSEDAVLLSY